jgi:prepilin-type N-terminal cleavage/methylation domain-containing protein
VNCLNSAPADFIRHRRRPAFGKTRGFTLTEILVVIFMIAILAAVASPSFVKVMRDANLNRLNMRIADVYRTAYLESAGQTTTLVHWNAAASPPDPLMEIVRATLDSNTPTLVSPRRCGAIDWADPAHVRTTIIRESASLPEFSAVGYLNSGNTEIARADICYSQRRAYVRHDDGVFTELPSAARFFVKNNKTNVIRKVLIPSFGLPRLAQ